MNEISDDAFVDMLQRHMETELNFPMISFIKDYVYPADYFYDTFTHLNDTGVQVRTEQLIADLKVYQSKSGKQNE